jgi:putative transposase
VARKPRIELAGGIHHVTARGNRREPIFHGDADRRLFQIELTRTVRRKRWGCLSYCLMGNHFHLVLETPETNLGHGMRDLLTRFVQRSNERRGTDGRAFQDRFHSVLVHSDEHFACLLRYVALNPFNAGLCSDPREYPWSSHAAMLAARAGPLVAVDRVEELLECWGGATGARYSRLLTQEHDHFGGWSAALEPTPPRPSIAHLLASLPPTEAMAAARRSGYRLREIAAVAGVSEATVSRRTRPKER